MSFRYTWQTRQQGRECQEDAEVHGYTRSRVQCGKRRTYVAITCTSILELAALVSSFLFMLLVSSSAVFVIIDGEVVDHVPKINCSSINAVFV